jgi:hypothetical protein
MSDRLISADKAKEVLKHLLYETAMNNDLDIADIYEDIAERRLDTWIELIPTVDAVPVVRCKDCESWGLNAIKKDEKGEVIYGDCLHFCCSTPKWFYCAWGERKNGQ